MGEEDRPQRYCPHLGLKHTKAIRFSSPTPEHRCYIFGEPLPIDVDQRTYCLSEGHVRCPRFTGEEPPPAAVSTGGPSRAARREARERRPSRLALFWQQLSRRDRILYLSLIGVLILILATYGVVAGLVLPNRGAPTATPTATATVAPTLEEPTAVVPTEATRPIVAPSVSPTPVPEATTPPIVVHTPSPSPEASPQATARPTRRTSTPPPTTGPTEPPATSTPTPVLVVPTDTPPPPTSLPTSPPPPPTSPPETMWSTLYFLGPSKAYYVPVNRQGPYTLAVARRALEEMVEGPGPGLLRSMPAGMGLLGVDRQGSTLYVDLDHTFEQLGAGDAERTAVVLAMTEFSTVDQVQFLVNGSTSAGPLGRPAYVNYENPDGLTPEESVALTLYFATPDGRYLFPLVRRVSYTPRTARQTILEMIKGPSAAYNGLAISPLPPDLQINTIDRVGDMIVVDFDSAFWNAPNQDMAIDALALAMTSLTADSPQGVNAVRISVEGSLLGTYYRPLINPE